MHKLLLSAFNLNSASSAVPQIRADILTSGTPVLGLLFIFVCEINITTDTRATLMYTLIQEARGTLNTGNVAELPFVMFDPLTLADAGSYQCAVTVSSPFLTEDITIMTDVLEVFLTSKL